MLVRTKGAIKYRQKKKYYLLCDSRRCLLIAISVVGAWWFDRVVGA